MGREALGLEVARTIHEGATGELPAEANMAEVGCGVLALLKTPALVATFVPPGSNGGEVHERVVDLADVRHRVGRVRRREDASVVPDGEEILPIVAPHLPRNRLSAPRPDERHPWGRMRRPPSAVLRRGEKLLAADKKAPARSRSR